MAADLRTNSKPAPQPFTSPAASDLAKATSAARPSVAPATAPGRSFSEELTKPETAAKRSPLPAKDTQNDEPSTARPSATNGAAADKNSRQTPETDDENRSKQQIARKNLSPLKKTIEQKPANKAAVENAPVLAFLSGHLERLQPGSIPALVTNNEFLNEALTQTDVGAFLNEPMTAGELLESLELPESLLAEAAVNGLDLNLIVSPSDVFRTLGLDPQRVTSELGLLRDNLSLAGVAPYMQRAAALRATLGSMTQDGKGITAGTPLDPSNESQRDLQRAGLDVAPTTLGPVNPGVLPLNAAGLAAQPVSQGPSPTATTAVSSSSAINNISTSNLPPAMVTPPSPLTASYLRQLTTVNIAPTTALARPNSGQTLPSNTVAFPELSSQITHAPQMQTATYDAFAAMNERLRGTDVISQNFGPTQKNVTLTDHSLSAKPSIEDQLISKILMPSDFKPAVILTPEERASLLVAGSPALLSEPTTDATTKSSLTTPVPEALSIATMQTLPALKSTENVALAPENLATTSTLKDLPIETPAVENQNIRPRDYLEHLKAISTTRPAGATGLEQNLTAKPALANAKPIEELQLTIPTVLSGGFARNSDSQNAGDPKDQGAQREQQSEAANVETITANAHQVGHSAGQTTHGLFDLESMRAPEQVITPQQRAEFVQKVLDQATAAIKDGNSGMVHLDLGSREFGQLEMAVSMQDDKVDLKIMAASDRARDLLAGELGKLRDALSVQNVQLGQVDVGVGGRQPSGSAAHFMNHGQFSGQFAQNQQFNQSSFDQRRQQADETTRTLRVADSAIRQPDVNRPMLSLIPSNIYRQGYNQAGRLEVRV